MNVVLIGYRATGKTTVARHLALLLGWDWVDADVEVELKAGKSIAAIFADDGEQAFRDLESQVLAELVRRERSIIAAGGGAVMREENRRAIRSAKHVVWLKAPVEVILERLAADPTTAERRPRLSAAGSSAEEVRDLLAQRTPYYYEVADLELDTVERSPDELADRIMLHFAIVPGAGS